MFGHVLEECGLFCRIEFASFIMCIVYNNLKLYVQLSKGYMIYDTQSMRKEILVTFYSIQKKKENYII